MTARGKRVANYTPHPGSVWINSNCASLPNNEWVAADKNGLVDHDSLLDLLMQKIASKGIKAEDVAIAYNTNYPRV